MKTAFVSRSREGLMFIKYSLLDAPWSDKIEYRPGDDKFSVNQNQYYFMYINNIQSFNGLRVDKMFIDSEIEPSQSLDRIMAMYQGNIASANFDILHDHLENCPSRNWLEENNYKLAGFHSAKEGDIKWDYVIDSSIRQEPVLFGTFPPRWILEPSLSKEEMARVTLETIKINKEMKAKKAIEQALIKNQMKLFSNPFYGLEV